MEEKTTITLPPKLAQQVRSLVEAGWFPDLDALVVEAVRRYLESHRVELTEHYIWQDVEWGLRGND
jgi:Arc/MetJ-type ribon-helix-helix transcriptional regulator